MAETPFTALHLAPGDAGLVVVAPAPIAGGHLQIVSPDYAHPLRAALGMPTETSLYRVSVTDLPGWPGYTCELVAAPETYTFVAGQAVSTSPAAAPRFTLHVAAYPVPLTLILWRRRVSYQRTSLYLEAQWRPETGETLALHGLTWQTTHDTVRQLLRGRRLLTTLGLARGRPADLDAATFSRLASEAYYALLDHAQRDGTRLPTKGETAAQLLMHPRTFKRHRDRAQVPWPPLPPR
jgi:hypothetical protein